MRLDKLKNVTRPLVVEFGDESLNIEFYENRFTPAMEEKINNAAKGDDPSVGKVLQPLILPLCKDWDLEDMFPVLDGGGSPVLDEDNQPRMELRKVPIDPDGMYEVPIPILLAIQKKMLASSVSDTGEAKSSNSGSFS